MTKQHHSSRNRPTPSPPLCTNGCGKPAPRNRKGKICDVCMFKERQKRINGDK
ncbi:MAG: hypothetical protein KGK07_15970 [Chloroflexota bacterium]|nr:hypothetical protein [Chloroflexota bacterium]